jgi:hypothetical protein
MAADMRLLGQGKGALSADGGGLERAAHGDARRLVCVSLPLGEQRLLYSNERSFYHLEYT